MAETSPPAGPFKIAPHISWRRVEEESVLLNVDTGEYYSLDPTASSIWERIERGDKTAKIVKDIAKEYGKPETRVEKDAQEFLNDLLSEKLIQPAD
jgi:hypothetical protein